MLNMISIEGIDRAGKSTLFKHLQWLGNHEHVILDRGPLSNHVFSKMFNRGFTYDMKSFTNVLFVFLDVDYDDWIVRCKATGEPEISYDKHYAMYEEALDSFMSAGCVHLRYNTSKTAMHQIAVEVLKRFDELNSSCR